LSSDHQATTEVPFIQLEDSPGWDDYELLDTGNGQKLERYGAYRLIRPEAEAVWRPALPSLEWEKAHATFQPTGEEHGGHWVFRKPVEPRWQMQYKGLRFWAQTSASRHLGVFPEQATQWDWMESVIQSSGRPARVLNLFGYTGLASLASARAGAQVTHVDASKKALTWAKDNQDLSGLSGRPIRWILEDALKFVRREARRGSRYEGLILDPPKFGRGPKGEVWEFYKLLPALLEDCRAVLSPQPMFVVLTAYAVKASPLTLRYAVEEMLRGYKGNLASGEVVLREKSAGRLLPLAIFARWQNS
jgi:23S rRNA (cytosine1962-C5)-methyltransferase